MMIITSVLVGFTVTYAYGARLTSMTDGDINSAFTEDVTKRFEAYGWHTQHVLDGS
jgi:hypothetical protein